MRRNLFTALALSCSLIVCANNEGQQRYADFELCPAASTDIPCRLGYRTYGRFNADKSNIIIAPTWFSGVSGDLTDSGFLGLGKLYDTAKYYVIVIDAFGNGVSSSPSHNDVAKDIRFTIGDMVEAQYELLTEKLGIDHIYAVVGISMGGMQAFDWGARYPSYMDNVISIIGSAQLGAFDQINWSMQIETVEALLTLPEGESKALDFLTAVNAMIFYTPEYLDGQMQEKSLRNFLDGERAFAAKGDIQDKLSQMRSILSLDVAGHGANQTAELPYKMQFIYAPSDRAVTPYETIKYARKNGAMIKSLSGECGHLSLFCELETIETEVRQFLEAP